jgi:hypothetical protein
MGKEESQQALLQAVGEAGEGLGMDRQNAHSWLPYKEELISRQRFLR